ncbi:MAG: glutathione S-transferase family protein [Pseudomonas sp.]|uniref:glutathione S-transferase family protein n=1 Tax=Pseudomonas sp. TaxID=306 RepID=UPI0033952C37
MIILFWNPFSPYSRKVKMALDHKGLVYSCVMEGLFGEGGASAELKLKSPRGEVPILQDGDRVIWDSRVICEYLEEAYPANPMLPAEPGQRARSRQLEALCDSTLDAAIYAVFAGKVICKDAPLASAMAAQGADEVRALAAQFERELGSQRFLCGDRLCLADIALYAQLVGVVPLGVAVDAFPTLSAWMRRIRQTPIGEQDAVAVEEAFARARASTKQLRHQWRGERIEFAFRHGLEAFLDGEVQRGRAYFPPSPPALPNGQ